MASSPTSSASSSASGFPHGVSAPLETISSTDQGGLVAILAAFSLSLVLVSFPIRTYVRSKTGRFKMDDYAFVGASIFAVLQASIVFYELQRGLGKAEDPTDPQGIVSLQKAAYSTDILYIVTMFLSKCSTAFLFLRLTTERGHAFAIWGTISASVVWAIVSILLVAFRCHSAYPWTDISNECTGLFARWAFIGALDMLTEAALFLISVYLVWGIQMSKKSKTTVVCAFGCRLPVIALAGLRLHYLQVEINSPNMALLASNAVSCTQFEIGYSIMASIVPCLKTFMKPYERQFNGAAQYRNYAYDTGTGTSLKLSSLRSISRGDAAAGGTAAQRENKGRLGAKFMGKLRPEQMISEEKVVTRSERAVLGRKSAESESSRGMIIKKGVEWSVAYDGISATPGSKEDDPCTIEDMDSRERERRGV